MFGKRYIEVEVEKEVKIEKPVYIPIPSYGNYVDLWQTPTYLHEVINAADTRPFNVEVLEAIRIIREYADQAKIPEELQGINKALNVVKKLLVIKQEAKQKLDDINFCEEQNKAENVES